MATEYGRKLADAVGDAICVDPKTSRAALLAFLDALIEEPRPHALAQAAVHEGVTGYLRALRTEIATEESETK